MLQLLNTNAGAVTALATVALLTVTVFYAWTTYLLFKEARQSRLLAGLPRVVAYLRPHRVHTNIVQLCIANLSGVAAVGVSAKVDKVTEWPEKFYFQDSRILRDISYLRAHEVLEFDLGIGPDFFRNDEPAVFHCLIRYQGLDGREFAFDDQLRVESVEGHSHFKIYTVDDVARRLEDIRDLLRGFAGHNRLKVETYDTEDRELERRRRAEERESFRLRQSQGGGLP